MCTLLLSLVEQTAQVVIVLRMCKGRCSPNPQYQICKENKSGVLVFPKDMTVLGTVDTSVEGDMQMELSAHAQPLTSSSCKDTSSEFVSNQHLDHMNQQ